MSVNATLEGSDRVLLDFILSTAQCWGYDLHFWLKNLHFYRKSALFMIFGLFASRGGGGHELRQWRM